MESAVGMRFTRVFAAVLFSLLLGWGGAVMSGAAASVAPHPAVSSGESAGDGCDERPGHHGYSVPGHHGYSGNHKHHDHRTEGDHGEHSKLSHQGCCAMACGMSALEPADPGVNPVEWTSVRVQPLADDVLRDRSVSPLRRPPRPAA
ncbi:hypothetical protein JL101_003465 [Skermanella rosea]|uniref:hypothetical protein n=1 Tax=Skermanella rosea TaxID=1817965 RepID=UPI001933AFD0|nr:hypothetical protein [Skermanella rosea]UEM04514.1 hypothetical protein JL101_003465 [Skermanella rosea]